MIEALVRTARLLYVVDDDAGIRDALGEFLQLEGFQVRTCVHGVDALNQLRGSSERPDLILLDLMMPVSDGVEFRKAQLQDSRFAHIPVIVLSASPLAQEKFAGLHIESFCRKPIDIDDLLKAITKELA